MHDVCQRPCFFVENGVFQIRTRSIQYRLQWQPEPLAMEHICGARSWRQCYPDFRLVRPVDPKTTNELLAIDLPKDLLVDEQKTAAFVAFRALLPEHVVRAVAQFVSHQWAMLVLLHDRHEACELAEHNPVLAYALANHAGFRGTRIELAPGDAGRHCTDRQREILKWLGFPDSEALVKVFRKIAPESVSPMVLRRLRGALLDDSLILDLLAHVPRINAGVLWSVLSPIMRDLVSPKLLLAISSNEADMILSHTPNRLSIILSLLKESGGKIPGAPLTTLAQVERLQETCDVAYRQYLVRKEEERVRAEEDAAKKERRRQMAAEARRRRLLVQRRQRAAVRQQDEVVRRQHQKILARPYPEPPVPGTAEIVPITSDEDLWTEGQDQKNCVGGYTFMVKSGQHYIYRVLNPQRCTLSIVRGVDGGWWRSELKLAGNAMPSPQTISHVDAWLARHSLSV